MIHTTKHDDQYQMKLELCRAHTPRAASASCSASDSLYAEVCTLDDDLYLHVMLGYAHLHKAHGGALIGVANKKKTYLGRSWALPNDSKHNEAGFSTISTDSLCLLVTQMPRSRDLAIFVLTTDDRQTHKPIALPLLPRVLLLRMRTCGVMSTAISVHT
jgi:hypothetical protein